MSEFMELLPFLLPLAIAEIVLLGYTIYHILTHKKEAIALCGLLL